jgi:hypothetical protein
MEKEKAERNRFGNDLTGKTVVPVPRSPDAPGLDDKS